MRDGAVRYRRGRGQTRDGAPKLPSVGRLGLVDRLRPTTWRSWAGDHRAHVDLLWSLSRAPDADAALRAMVRLAETLGDRLGRAQRGAAQGSRPARRLLAVLGSSLALGDHLVANPQSWHLLRGKVKLPTRRAAATGVHRVRRRIVGRLRALSMPRLRILYRDQLLVLAALDLAPTVENEPVLPFPRSAPICPTWPTPHWRRR